jgi:hypothetical protein
MRSPNLFDMADWVEFYNGDATTVPAFGVMRIIGQSMSYYNSIAISEEATHQDCAERTQRTRDDAGHPRDTEAHWDPMESNPQAQHEARRAVSAHVQASHRLEQHRSACATAKARRSPRGTYAAMARGVTSGEKDAEQATVPTALAAVPKENSGEMTAEHHIECPMP